MPPLTSLAPTTAERIRSACARAGGALLVVEREDPVPVPIHHLLYDGSFAVAVPVDRGEVSGSQALLELTDYAPLPVCVNPSVRWCGSAAASTRSRPQSWLRPWT